MELYEWQKECLENWAENQYNGIVNVVTGAGKTVLALAAISLLSSALKSEGRRLRVRIVVPTTWLSRQWKDALEEHFPGLAETEGIGIFSGTRKDSFRCSCTIYVVNSARYTITRHMKEDLEEGFDVLLIADECHHYGSPENRKILDYQKYLKGSESHIYTLALSATPECAEYDRVLKPSFGDEIYRYGFEKAVRERTVSSYRIAQVALSFTSRELSDYDELSTKIAYISTRLKEEYPSLKKLSIADFIKAVSRLASQEEELPSAYLALCFQRADISRNAEARIGCTLSLIRRLEQSKKVLIFCERISQAEALYTQMRGSVYGKVVRYHSDLSREARHTSLEQFRSGEARILISCRALDEGMDVPAAEVGIVMSCESQQRQRIQRLGRILRRSPEKDTAVLYYLYVSESSEDRAYLPDLTDSSRIFYLDYLKEDDDFLNHSYEELAANLWSEALELFPADDAKQHELRKCLQEGLVRQDYLQRPEYCAQQITSAQTQHEKNYWICMKRLCGMR